MRVGVLVTNHGSHPADKWAAESAAQIVDVIQIDDNSIVFDSMTRAKNKLQDDLEVALVSPHDTVKAHEGAAIDKHGPDRLDHPLAPEAEHLEDAVNTVLAVTDQSMFATHFRKPEVRKFVESTLGSHFASVRHIERSWYVDKNPNHPKAKAFRDKYHG